MSACPDPTCDCTDSPELHGGDLAWIAAPKRPETIEGEWAESVRTELISCPGCWRTTPVQDLCEDDDPDTGPLCWSCCQKEHRDGGPFGGSAA